MICSHAAKCTEGFCPHKESHKKYDACRSLRCATAKVDVKCVEETKKKPSSPSTAILGYYLRDSDHEFMGDVLWKAEAPCYAPIRFGSAQHAKEWLDTHLATLDVTEWEAHYGEMINQVRLLSAHIDGSLVLVKAYDIETSGYKAVEIK